MNKQIFNAALSLGDAQCSKAMGAFFGSIKGTLNHLLVGDLLWFSRFVAHSDRYHALIKISEVAQPTALNDILFEKTEALFEARAYVDGLIEQWTMTELKQEDLSRCLVYKNAKGVRGNKPFRELLSHVFNHQTHHRGQVSTLLHQCGVDVGVTDLLMDVPDCAD